MKNYSQEKHIETENGTITAFKVDNDINGNPRWVVHYLGFFKDYENNQRLKHGLHKYRGKWFGGGYVVSSYNIDEKIKNIIKDINSEEWLYRLRYQEIGILDV